MLTSFSSTEPRRQGGLFVAGVGKRPWLAVAEIRRGACMHKNGCHAVHHCTHINIKVLFLFFFPSFSVLLPSVSSKMLKCRFMAHAVWFEGMPQSMFRSPAHEWFTAWHYSRNAYGYPVGCLLKLKLFMNHISQLMPFVFVFVLPQNVSKSSFLLCAKVFICCHCSRENGR